MAAKICCASKRRQAKRRLVEQDQPRPAHQRAADRQHLLLAAGERAAALISAVAQPRKQREHALEVGIEVGGVGHGGADLQILHHRHARKNAAAFRRLRDAELGDLVRRQAGDVAAGEADTAFAGARVAEHRHHQRRFAGAVGADQRDDLAFVDVDIDAFEGDDAAVIGFDAAQREQRFAVARSQSDLRAGLLDFFVGDAEIGGDYLGVVADILRSAVGDFHAVVEHDDMVGNLHHHAHVVLDEQD